MKKYLNSILLLTGLSIFLSGECWGEKKPNVILITVDTLRADHLHCYGYEKETSPALDRLAGEGALFESVSSVSSLTTQSLASLITGRYPQTIGVRWLNGKLKGNELTLTEVLKQNGYKTGVFLANPVLKNSNVDQGFDFSFISSLRTPATVYSAKLLSWLKTNQKNSVFAWIHFIDPHMPYKPPKDIVDRFDPNYRGRFAKEFRFYTNPDREKKIAHELSKQKVVFNQTKLSQQELKRIRVLYDGEIAYTDMIIGKLIDDMKTLGIMDNTLLVISADHGESLGEHKYFFAHGAFIYSTTIEVPLIFHFPGKLSPRRISQNVSTIDILPTILSIVGIADPFDRREGRNLSGVLLNKEKMESLPVYFESSARAALKKNKRRYVEGVKGMVRGLREGNWKMILTPTKSEPVLELYNLDIDPSETNNLAEKEPERTREMSQKLKKWMKKGINQVVPQTNKKTRKLLRALGYIN